MSEKKLVEFKGFEKEKILSGVKEDLEKNVEEYYENLSTNPGKRKFQALLYLLFGLDGEVGLRTAPSNEKSTFEQNALQGFFEAGIYREKSSTYKILFDQFKRLYENISNLNETEVTYGVLIDTINNSEVWSDGLNKWVGKLEKKNKETIRKNFIEFLNTGKISEDGENETTDSDESDSQDKDDKEIEKDIIANIDNYKQIIFTGAPGTGKTYSVREYVKKLCVVSGSDDKKQYDEEQYKFVQFHPSYDYSDFVEGLRPVVLKDGNAEPTFVRMDGVFKAFCRHIVEENNKDKNYYFIVDEINRADLAKVFGELMFGLEESYRGKDNLIQTQYKNLDTYKIVGAADVDNQNIVKKDVGKAIPIEKDVFRDGFYIPENLFFIGTMNDIDRSVDSMDFALRRRFQWIEVEANKIMTHSLHSILDKDNKDIDSDKYMRIEVLAKKIKAMNDIVSSDDYRFGLSKAYHIGPAYFKKLDISSDEKLQASLKLVFETNVVSILREYTRGRKEEEVNKWIGECRKKLLGDN